MKKEQFDEFLNKFDNSVTLGKIATEAATLHDIKCNQKYDGKPYSFHLNMVADFAMKYGYMVCEYEYHIIPMLFGAYFHDAIEDARVTYNDVKNIALKYMTEYQANIATEIVYALTDEKGRNRAERGSEKHYEDIRNTWYAPFVKLCDRLANATYSKEKGGRMYDVYVKEMPEFIVKLGGDKYVPKELNEMALNI